MGRHYRLTTWLVFHYLKRTVSPLLRSSAEFIFIHRTGNAKLLEDIGTELFSMFITPKEFLNMLREQLKKDEYPNICLWVDKGKYDLNANEWSFIKQNRQYILDHMNIVNDHKKNNHQSKGGARTQKYLNQQSKVQKNQSFKVVNEKHQRRGNEQPNLKVLFGKV